MNIIVGAHVARPAKHCPPEVWSETQREFTADHKIVHAQIIVSGLAVNEQFLSAAHVVNNVHRSCVSVTLLHAYTFRINVICFLR